METDTKRKQKVAPQWKGENQGSGYSTNKSIVLIVFGVKHVNQIIKSPQNCSCNNKS